MANKQSASSGKPVKPKKPSPTRGTSAKVPVAIDELTEEYIRGIVREEISTCLAKRALRNIAIMRV